MNDRFKFRAWDERTKTCFDNAIIESLAPISTWLKHGWVVEQCTGLKDKNGRLIYEGDIISATTFDGHNRKFIVKYAEEDACFGLFVSKSMYISFNKVYEDSLEVIGNIHENPELVEEK